VIRTRDHKEVRSLFEEVPGESDSVGCVIVNPRRPQIAVDQAPDGYASAWA
jgi:hypothetical protein